MARWRGGAVARWRGGAVARWRGGAVARWRGGAVARWRGGAVARAPDSTKRTRVRILGSRVDPWASSFHLHCFNSLSSMNE